MGKVEEKGQDMGKVAGKGLRKYGKSRGKKVKIWEK